MDEKFEADHKTPEYVHSAESIKFLASAAAIFDRNRLGQREIERLTEVFAKKHATTFGFGADLKFPQQTTSALLKGAKFSKIPDAEKFRLMWIWLHTDHPDVVKVIHSSISDEWQPDLLSRALNGLLTPGSELDREVLVRIRGRYLVYRRYYGLPHRVMVAELKCGFPTVDQFTMSMPHTMVGGTPAQDPVVGCITPYGGGILFVGKFVEMNGPFIFTLQSTQFNAPGGKLSRGEGMLLAAAQTVKQASAYPLLVLNSEASVGTGVITKEEAEKDEDLWAEFSSVYERGFINWR